MNNSRGAFTPAAQQAQAERGSSKAYERRMAEGFPDTPELAKFIAEQETAFLATATADGAPYLQHRGGPKGFIKVIDDRTSALPTTAATGIITLANLSENDRAFLFLLDPARRQRIKLWGRARVVENHPTLIERLFDKGYKARPERVILFTIEVWETPLPYLTRFRRGNRGSLCCRAKQDRRTGRKTQVSEPPSQNNRHRSLNEPR